RHGRMDDQQAGGTGHDQGRGETELRKADRSLCRPSRSFQGRRAFNRGQALGLRELRRASQNPTRDRAEKFFSALFLVPTSLSRTFDEDFFACFTEGWD